MGRLGLRRGQRSRTVSIDAPRRERYNHGVQRRDWSGWVATGVLALACQHRNVEDVAQRRGDDETHSAPTSLGHDLDASRAAARDASNTPTWDAAPTDSPEVTETAAPQTLVATAASSETVGSSNSSPNPYVPSGSDVPVGGDGRLAEGGSFEASQGFGWDTCPGAAANGIGVFVENSNYAPDANVAGAADGERYVHLLPPLPEGDPDRPEGVDAPFAFYLDAGNEILANAPQYLYFDIENLADTPANGVLVVAGLEFTCETKEPWLTVSLSDLAISQVWETRCVEFVATEDFQVFGIWMSGTDYSVGVDAFRFGPPCH